MKKIFLLVMLIILSVSVFADTLKIGYFQLEPYIIPGEDGTEPSGIIVDFWEDYLAPAMDVDLEWVGPVTMGRLERMLETGEIDTVALMIKTPPRMEKFLYPDESFISMLPSLTLRKEDPMPQPDSLEDIYGLRLGYIEGANVPPYLVNDNIILDRATQADYKTANFQKLLRNRIDAILDLNMLSNIYEARSRGIEDKIRIIPLPVSPTPMYSPFLKSSRGATYIEKYNQALSEVPAETMEELIEPYFN